MDARAKFILIALISLFGIDLHAQGIPYQLNPPAPNARVQFCPVPDGGYPCPTLTTVYSDSAATQVINQPISTGSSGNLSVYFAAGTSSVTVQLLGQGYGPQNRFVVALGGGGGTPGGSNTQIQYNNSGAFGGTTVTWDSTNSRVLAPNGSAANPTYSFTNATGTGMYNIGGDVGFASGGSVLVDLGPSLFASVASTFRSPGYSTTNNCSSSASPAVCATAAGGSVAIAAAATTLTVNTTAVTANSQILLMRDDSLGARLSVTCNTATVMGEMKVSSRTAGTSFTITVQTAPATNPGCISYFIVN